jgi:hypothetical protein
MAATEDDFDRTVLRIAAEVLGVAESSLRPDMGMTALKARNTDYQLIFERSAAALGVDMTPIINSMPLYTVKGGDSTMSSLRMLGGILPAARDLLARLTVAPVDDTLASIAASLRSGHFVDSGLKQPPLHQPYSLRGFLAWLLLPPLLLMVILPVGVAFMEHRQCGTEAEALPFILGRAWRGDGPILVGLPLTVVVLMVQLLPGFLALWQEQKLRRDRQRL